MNNITQQKICCNYEETLADNYVSIFDLFIQINRSH